MKNSVKILFTLLITLFIVSLVLFRLKVNSNDTKFSLNLNGKEVTLIIADTTALKEHGLGDRESLPDNTAMLFIFDTPYKYSIWMKDMKFPIDIFWINSKGEIITLEENISPDTYPKIFTPVGNSSFVLETNAGFAKKNNIKVGNFLNLTQK